MNYISYSPAYIWFTLKQKEDGIPHLAFLTVLQIKLGKENHYLKTLLMIY